MFGFENFAGLEHAFCVDDVLFLHGKEIEILEMLFNFKKWIIEKLGVNEV